MTKKIPIEEFLPAYLKAAERGLSKEEFAVEIGLKASTVYQRVYELRRDVDPTIPLLKGRGRVSLAEKAKAILDAHSFGNGKTVADAPAKKQKAKPEPKPEANGEMEEESAELDKIFG
jgi:hypothetical protein